MILFLLLVPALIDQSPIVRIEHFRGGITNISCTATGLPVPTVTWFKNEEIFSLSDRVFVVEKNKSDDISGYIESTLVFATLELSDNASYYCQANNTGAPGNEFIVTSNSSFVFVTRKYSIMYWFYKQAHEFLMCSVAITTRLSYVCII